MTPVTRGPHLRSGSQICYDLLSFCSVKKVFPFVLMIGSSPLRWLFFYLIVSRYQTDFTSPWKLTSVDWGESSTHRSQSPWLVTTTPGRATSCPPTAVGSWSPFQIQNHRVNGDWELSCVLPRQALLLLRCSQQIRILKVEPDSLGGIYK